MGPLRVRRLTHSGASRIFGLPDLRVMRFRQLLQIRRVGEFPVPTIVHHTVDTALRSYDDGTSHGKIWQRLANMASHDLVKDERPAAHSVGNRAAFVSRDRRIAKLQFPIFEQRQVWREHATETSSSLGPVGELVPRIVEKINLLLLVYRHVARSWLNLNAVQQFIPTSGRQL